MNRNKITPEQFTLTSEEKAHMKGMLLEYVAMTPVRDATVPREKIHTSSFSLFTKDGFVRFFTTLSHTPLTATIIFLLFISGGVSYAAEGALPGEALYPIKFSINEVLYETFSFSDEARATWEARRAERRIEEVVTLTQTMKDVSPDLLSSVVENFNTHAQNVSEKIARIDARSPEVAAKISSLFENSLVKHEQELLAVEVQLRENTTATVLSQTADSAPASFALESAPASSLKVSAKVGAEIALDVATSTMLTPLIQSVRTRIELTRDVAKASALVKNEEKMTATTTVPIDDVATTSTTLSAPVATTTVKKDQTLEEVKKENSSNTEEGSASIPPLNGEESVQR